MMFEIEERGFLYPLFSIVSLFFHRLFILDSLFFHRLFIFSLIFARPGYLHKYQYPLLIIRSEGLEGITLSAWTKVFVVWCGRCGKWF